MLFFDRYERYDMREVANILDSVFVVVQLVSM